MDDSLLAEALQAVLDAASAAWANGDADEFAALYTSDATAILPGFRLVDREAIRSSMAGAFEGPLRATRRVHRLQEVRRLGADAAVATTASATPSADAAVATTASATLSADAAVASTASATLSADHQEAPTARDEWATWVFVRQPGDVWRIKAYHGSPVLAG